MKEIIWPESIARATQGLAAPLLQRGWMLATAESCTGGLIAGACTELAGASNWFERGFVSYSNAAKTELLGVPAGLIATHGAVSEPVARAMAAGAAQRAGTQVAVAVTGVAGPSGGSPGKPVGTVWFGWSVAGTVFAECRRFTGGRSVVRLQTVAYALDHLRALIVQDSRGGTARR